VQISVIAVYNTFLRAVNGLIDGADEGDEGDEDAVPHDLIHVKQTFASSLCLYTSQFTIQPSKHRELRAGHFQGECSCKRADSVRRFNVGRVHGLNDPLAIVHYMSIFMGKTA